MKDVFFAGDISLNNGPSNVNKELYKYLKNEFQFIETKNKWIFYILYIIRTIKCDVIVYSGILKIDIISLRIAKILRKKIIYIMHGCVQYEQGEINKTPTMGGDRIENDLFKYSELILCVSAPFAKWFRKYRSEFCDKVEVLTNGIPWDNLSIIDDNIKSDKQMKIILLGGGRVTKANLNVVKAVNIINDRYNAKCIVDLYGYYREDDDSKLLEKYSFVNFCGMVDHEELMRRFSTSTVFVQNSIFEPFSLACIEAICHNCSILVSVFVGCSSVLSLEENDIIHNPFDVEEIAKKLLLFKGMKNYSRILTNIDKISTSCEMSAKKLREYVYQIKCRSI